MLRSARLFTALMILLGLASTAGAFDQTTRWFTLDVADGPDGRPLFLTTTGEGVKLMPYHSGDPTQMWALVQPDYPNAPGVSGDGLGPSDCVSTSSVGCPFSGHASLPIRLVSRSSGGCLLFVKSGATTSECSTLSAKTAARQTWQYFERGGFAVGTPHDMRTQGKCLVALPNKYDPTDRVAAAGDCSFAAAQMFTAQVAAELSCRTDWAYNLCFRQD